MTSAPTIIQGLPQQIADGMRAADAALRETRLPKISRKTTHVIFCGMGGSALPGLLVDELLRNDQALRKLHLHTVVHRSYGLPKEAAVRPTLVVVLSYSGNTEEALSSYVEARKRRLPILVVASGGKLSALAERDRIPLARIPQGLPPRFAVGAQLAALISFLVAIKILPKRIHNELRAASSAIHTEQPRTQAKTLAKQLSRRIPLFYASERNASLAYLLKIQINENTKIPAFMHVFPELNHNEFNSYAKLSPKQTIFHRNLAVILLKDATDRREVRNRMSLTQQMIRKTNVAAHSIVLSGSTPLLRMLYALIFGEWLALELATLYNVDPLPTDLIEEFKKKLK